MNFNQVQIMGYVGNPAKVYRSAGKKPFATLQVATNSYYLRDGEKVTDK